MRLRYAPLLLAILPVLHPASAQQAPVPGQPDPRIIAQAYDRCMATHAVRLTKTSASDAEIYAQARQSCAPLNDQLASAFRARLPPEEASKMLRALDAQAAPNFLTMIARIRSDRARRDESPAPLSTPVPATGGFDAANPVHCAMALGMLALVADTVSPKDSPEVRRRQALAEQRVSAQFSPEEAKRIRGEVWPLLRNNQVLLNASETCPK